MLVTVFLIQVYLIYSVSGVQQSDSVIHMYILFRILFHYRLLQGVEYNPPCYTVGLVVYLFYSFSHFNVHKVTWGSCLNVDADLVDRWSRRFCSFDKLSGDTVIAAGPGTTL